MADLDEDCECDDEEISRRTRGAQERTKELTRESTAFARAITGAFAQGVTGAKSFDTVLKSLALRLSTLALNMALKPVTSSLASGLQQVFGGLSNAFSGSSGGAASDSPSIIANAKGGVIAAPTYFPLGNSRVGLAGEAGPEAIMPLARGADGRLGVMASGGAGANVTVNIATPDAESFRRSETYLTGLIARAVARGQRGM